MRFSPSNMAASRSPFILVHGAWHGAWCWQRVTPLLQEAGHDVYLPTCPGMGERIAELTPEIGLGAMIDDLARQIDGTTIRDAVLVGHSFGGWIIAGLADRLAHRLRHLVFLDANHVQHGASPFDTLPPETVAARRAAAALSPGGLTMPAPGAGAFGIADRSDIAWVDGQLTPHPLRSYQEPLQLAHPLGRDVPKTYIACMDPPFVAAGPARDWVKTQQDWSYCEIASGHDAMVIAPALLAERLLHIASIGPAAS